MLFDDTLGVVASTTLLFAVTLSTLVMTLLLAVSVTVPLSQVLTEVLVVLGVLSYSAFRVTNFLGDLVKTVLVLVAVLLL